MALPVLRNAPRKHPPTLQMRELLKMHTSCRCLWNSQGELVTAETQEFIVCLICHLLFSFSKVQYCNAFSSIQHTWKQAQSNELYPFKVEKYMSLSFCSFCFQPEASTRKGPFSPVVAETSEATWFHRASGLSLPAILNLKIYVYKLF